MPVRRYTVYDYGLFFLLKFYTLISMTNDYQREAVILYDS